MPTASAGKADQRDGAVARLVFVTGATSQALRRREGGQRAASARLQSKRAGTHDDDLAVTCDMPALLAD